MEKDQEFPAIQIGDKTYPVKFTRGKLYDMAKAGIEYTPRIRDGKVMMNRAQAIDVLHMLVDFKGTQHDLAELMWDRTAEVVDVLWSAWVKAYPPAPVTVQPQDLAETKPVTETKQ
jgi:hypothetical protein